jgi:hypothetical protein
MSKVLVKSGTNGSQVRPRAALSVEEIDRAVRTVRVKNRGKRWSVKRIAAPKTWSFQNFDRALAKAIELATPDKLNVVVHEKRGQITEVISPREFSRPVTEFGPKKIMSRFQTVRNRPSQVSATTPSN